MARPLRIEYPGAFYHIISRGNEQKSVFRDDKDRETFLKFLQTSHDRYQSEIILYCLMDNHYHLMLETPQGNLSEIMHHINAGYTGYFNRRHNRAGHLFQGRYKAILVERESYGLELSRYIHLNPVRFGIIKRPEDYGWSSYRVYIGAEKKPDFLKSEILLSYFGNSLQKARFQYRAFVESGMKEKLPNPLEDIASSLVLGSAEFIEWVQDSFLREKSATRDLPALKALIRRASPEKIEQEVKKMFHEPKLARKVTLYLLHRCSGLHLKTIGGLFNGLSESAVSQATRRFESEMIKERKLAVLVKGIEKRIMSIV
ncbi:MAG: transposase [bacterium]